MSLKCNRKEDKHIEIIKSFYKKKHKIYQINKTKSL